MAIGVDSEQLVLFFLLTKPPLKTGVYPKYITQSSCFHRSPLMPAFFRTCFPITVETQIKGPCAISLEFASSGKVRCFFVFFYDFSSCLSRSVFSCVFSPLFSQVGNSRLHSTRFFFISVFTVLYLVFSIIQGG